MIAHRLLIVEDERLVAEELRERLQRLGFTIVGVDSTAEEAITHVEYFRPSLVLMDIRLQGSQDGITAANVIRQRFGIPVVYLTAYSDPATVERAKVTAPYGYLLKPFHEREILVTIEMAIFKHSLEKQLREAERRQHEMWLAGQVQKKCFPPVPLLDGCQIGVVSYPASEASGDYVDVIPMAEGYLGLVIGDVSGHGMAAALLMAESRAYLHALLQVFRQPGRRLADQVGPTLSLLNRHFHDSAPADYFMTLGYARLHLGTRLLEFVGAGHPPGYVLDATGQVKVQLDSRGPPLGVAEGLDFTPNAGVMLAPGDLVLLFTDGLYEARDPQDAVFGHTRVLEVVRASSQQSAQQIGENLYQAARAFARAKPLADDVSVLILKLEKP
jgi:serine phosphatase RsbU (regulator of sigma subunit)